MDAEVTRFPTRDVGQNTMDAEATKQISYKRYPPAFLAFAGFSNQCLLSIEDGHFHMFCY